MYHIFSTKVAKDVGINAAVIYEHIAGWVRTNEANGKNFANGYYWTYNTKKAYAKLFPYMTEKQIRTALDKLIEKGYLIKARGSKNPYDRTLYYTILKRVVEHADLPKRAKGMDLKGQSSITKGNTTYNKPNKGENDDFLHFANERKYTAEELKAMITSIDDIEF